MIFVKYTKILKLLFKNTVKHTLLILPLIDTFERIKRMKR